MITDPKTAPKGAARAPRLRGLARPARRAADRADDDGVREQGRAARSARDRLPRAAGAARATARALAYRRLAYALPLALALYAGALVLVDELGAVARAGDCERGARRSRRSRSSPRAACSRSSIPRRARVDRDRARAVVAGRRARPDPDRALVPGTDQGPPLAVATSRRRRRTACTRWRAGALGARLGHADEAGRGRAARPDRDGLPLEEHRALGRPRLQAGLVPLRDVERLPGDDGRRGLLDRLQRRRLARSLRRQLVLELGHGALGGARRAATVRALRERAREVPQREREDACEPASAGRRLRRRRPERRRAARTSWSRRRQASICSGTRAAARSRRAQPAPGPAGTRAPPSPT